MATNEPIGDTCPACGHAWEEHTEAGCMAGADSWSAIPRSEDPGRCWCRKTTTAE